MIPQRLSPVKAASPDTEYKKHSRALTGRDMEKDGDLKHE